MESQTKKTRPKRDPIIEAITNGDANELWRLLGSEERAKEIRCGSNRERPADVILRYFRTGRINESTAFDLISAGIPERHYINATLNALEETDWAQSVGKMRDFLEQIDDIREEEVDPDCGNLASQALGRCLSKWSLVDSDSGLSAVKKSRGQKDKAKKLQDQRREHVNRLLKLRADPMAVSGRGSMISGETNMHLACSLGDPEIVKELLWRKGKTSQDRIAQILSSDFHLKFYGDLGIPWNLLTKPICDIRGGGTPSHRDAVGHSPLCWRIMNRKLTPSDIKVLAENQVNFNIRDPKKRSVPLELAMEQKAVFNALSKYGADESRVRTKKANVSRKKTGARRSRRAPSKKKVVSRNRSRQIKEPVKIKAIKESLLDLTKRHPDALFYPQGRADPDLFVDLKNAGTALADLICPRWVPKLKHVEQEKLDRCGSLIAGWGFLNPRYKRSWQRSGRPVPLVQLDLDEISRVTKVDVGSGLLQVYMAEEIWGSCEHTVVNVPRDVVERTELLLDPPPDKDAVEELKALLRRADRLAKKNEAAAKTTISDYYSEFEDELWKLSTAGLIWAASWLPGPSYEDIYLPARWPQQIVGWKRAGYALPEALEHVGDIEIQTSVESDDERDIDTIRSNLPIRKTIFGTTYFDHEMPSNGCILFDVHEILASDVDLRELDESPGVWRPLFSFPGPAGHNDPTDDLHTVFYRRGQRGKFYYKATGYRWNS